jgi:carbonic anhydrase
LAGGQKPKVIVLACADSRVSPELIFDKGLGELFVLRIAGNIADKVALGSIEYAVEHLHSSMIVIVGHEKCGAVAAAASKDEMPSQNLKALVDQIKPSLLNIKADATGDELALLQVQANVNQSAMDVLKNSAIIRTALEEKKIALVKAVYRLKSGEVVKLSK